MAIKKLLITVVVVLFALTAHYYLESKYNPEVVEFHFGGVLNVNELDKLSKLNQDGRITVNWEKQYKGQKLIMTTGLDQMVESIPISKGTFMADMSRYEAVIGDKAAQDYFGSLHIIGREMNILGKAYSIKGIVENSRRIYIPYSAGFQNMGWQKQIIKISVKSDKFFYLKLENIQNQLKTMGLEVFDTIIYKEKLEGYKNLMILSILYVLLVYSRQLVKRLIKAAKVLAGGYFLQIRTTELYHYLICNRMGILNAVGLCLLILLLILTAVKLISSLCIPPAFVPDNLFSLDSILRMLQQNWQRYLLHIKGGIDGILFDIKMMNTVFAALICGILAAPISKLFRGIREKYYRENI